MSSLTTILCQEYVGTQVPERSDHSGIKGSFTKAPVQVLQLKGSPGI